VLYSLGIDTTGNTVLLRHEGSGLESERVLSRWEGEDLAASIGLDPAGGAVYASLGTGGIVAWDGNAAGTIASEGRVPQRLAAARGTLVSINRDATLSVWDPAAKALYGDLYLLASGDWCLVGANGRWSATDGAAPLARVTVDGRSPRTRRAGASRGRGGPGGGPARRARAGCGQSWLRFFCTRSMAASTACRTWRSYSPPRDEPPDIAPSSETR